MASTEKGLKIMVTSFVLVLAAALIWALFFGPLAPVDQNARQDVGSVSMPVDKEMRATLTDLNNQFDLEELRMVVRKFLFVLMKWTLIIHRPKHLFISGSEPVLYHYR